MSTKFHTLICKIIKFKIDEKSFFPMPMEDNRVLEAKKIIFSSRHGWCIISFLSLSELNIYLQNLISTRGAEYWEKKYFPQWGMLKFTNKGRFLTIEKTSPKLLYWKFKRWAYALLPLLHRLLVSWKTQKSQFLVVFQSSPS
jgi:hypothetical protein